MTTHALLDAAAFLGALILFLLAAVAVLVVVAGIIVGVVVAPIARLVRTRGPRDHVTIDHDKDGGLRFDGPVDPATAEQMRAAFDAHARAAGDAGDAGDGLSDEQRRTIRETFGPGGPGVVRADGINLDKMGGNR
ncbi:hypothetical protein [Rhodococcoides fascians]|uniref:hypothetical protein n=1 Tax=Rhodococcoides fascians TaxID=1828 RepID=UPI000B33E4ED|nr:hypothetical protein [Rhodococcus fascians]